MTTATGLTTTDLKELAREHFVCLSTGDLELARRIVAPDHKNHMAADEPPACRLPGPAGFVATGAWLRFAFQELRWDEIAILSEGDWVVAHMRMHAIQGGPFVVFPPGKAPEVFPPTRKPVDVRQAHFFRFRAGKSTEHIAVRDDIAMMTQLGFLPPSPAVGIRLATWALLGKRSAAIAKATEIAAAEAGRLK